MSHPSPGLDPNKMVWIHDYNAARYERDQREEGLDQRADERAEIEEINALFAFDGPAKKARVDATDSLDDLAAIDALFAFKGA